MNKQKASNLIDTYLRGKISVKTLITLVTENNLTISFEPSGIRIYDDNFGLNEFREVEMK
jgi:hypothetical protein